VLLLYIEYRRRILHPASLLFLLLVAMTILPALSALLGGFYRALRGRSTPRAAAWVVATIIPAGFWTVWVGNVLHQVRSREIPDNLSVHLLQVAGASLMEAWEIYGPAHKLESQRLVMFYRNGVTQPRQDIAALDRHVAEMEELTGLRLRQKIFLVRGPMFGDMQVSYLGLSFGSSKSPASYLDRHELAHAVIFQHNRLDTDPPTLLVEGWAESQSKTPAELARQVLKVRDFIAEWSGRWSSMSSDDRHQWEQMLGDPAGTPRLVALAADNRGVVPSYLRTLTDPYWYRHHNGAIYPLGGAFCSYLLRTYGAGRFVQFYFAVHPGTFEQDCRRMLGVDLDQLERDFWEDVDRQAGT